jgi:hypothetical protein
MNADPTMMLLLIRASSLYHTSTRRFPRYNERSTFRGEGMTHTPFGYYDLLEAFAQPGCAVCRLLAHDVDRFLDTLLYEYPVEPAMQNSFRASRGLCHEHSWQLTRYNSVLAVGILYDAALDEVLRIMDGTPPAERPAGLARLLSSGGSSALADALEPQKPCPACVVRDDAEKRYLQVIGGYMSEARFGGAFRQSEGLCLPHFRGALAAARDVEQARLLTAAQRDIWTRLKGELEQFLHKMDAHYHQAMGTESTSWLRTLARMAGETRGE